MLHSSAAAHDLCATCVDDAERCAGGLGLAALQLAAATGAEPIGTAGSAAKRRHLRASGVQVAVTSRATEFVGELAAVGRQLEALLNSLTSPGACKL